MSSPGWTSNDTPRRICRTPSYANVTLSNDTLPFTGVSRSDAGVASGLVNTSRQIGGAVGLAAVSAIAAASTSNYVNAHPGVSAASGAALDHGFQTALYVLTGLLVLGALIAGGMIRSRPRPAEAESSVEELEPVREAA